MSSTHVCPTCKGSGVVKEDDSKKCNGCGEFYPRDSYYQYRKNGKLYPIWYCKECYKASKRDYYRRKKFGRKAA